MQGADLDACLHPQLGIEVRERFVEEKGGGIADDGAAHGDALALAAGKLAGLAVEEVRQAEGFRRVAHGGVDPVFWLSPVAQAVGHVVVDRHVRVEGVVLENHGDVALDRFELVHAAAADADLAAGDGFEAGDHAQEGGLAAARGADQHAKLARVDGEGEVGDDLDPTGIDLADVFDGDV